MKYEFTVNDEAVLGGSTKILGANVNFALALQPVVLKKTVTCASMQTACPLEVCGCQLVSS